MECEEEIRSWQTGRFSAAARIRRLMACLRALRLSGDHNKNNSVTTFLCTNRTYWFSKDEINMVRLDSHQPAPWLHPIFLTQNTASSPAHSTTSVLTSTAAVVRWWRLTVRNSLSLSWGTLARSALFFVQLPGKSWSQTQHFPSDQTGKCLFPWPVTSISAIIFRINYKKNKIQLWADNPGKYIRAFIESTKKSAGIRPFRWKCWHEYRLSLDILFLAQ